MDFFETHAHKILRIALFATVAFFAGIIGGIALYSFDFFAAVTLIVFVLIYYCLVYRPNHTRHDAQSDIFWEIWQSEEKVGVLSDERMNMLLRKDVVQNGRNAYAVTVLLWKAGLRLIWRFVQVVPLAVFWGAIFLLEFAPESFAEIVTQVHETPWVEIQAFAIITISRLFVFFAAIIMMLCESEFVDGVKRLYKEDVQRMLRDALEIRHSDNPELILRAINQGATT